MNAAVETVSYAQDDVLEEVVVTGSRIVRRDFEANSPLVTVDAADLETQTGLNVESYLNQLPNFNPAASPVTTQRDIQPTAVNSVGIASISLRGFGPNRNLVLVDGKRPTPNNALMVTDLNSIPSAMIERVEIISGGASAVYGADAIGGVTNFILRKDFEGAEFDFQRSETEAGDGEETRVTATVGADFADGRGNVTLSMERYDRAVALERNRDFFVDSWTDPNQPADDLFVMGSAGIVTNSFSFNFPNRTAVKALFPDSPADTNPMGTGPFIHRFRTGPNGEVWSIVGDNLSKYEALGGVYNLEFAKRNTFDTSITQQGKLIETLKWNDLEQYASAPQERYSVLGSTTFDITDAVSFYATVNFSESETHTLQYGTVPIWGWESSAPFNPVTDSPLDPTVDWTNPDNVTAAMANPDAFANPDFIPTGTPGAQHPVSNEVAMLLMMRPNPSDIYDVELYPSHSLPRRTTSNKVTYWQFESGLKFDLPFKDWTGDAYWSHGESNTLTISTGNLSLTRWRALVNSPDWGRGLGTDPANPVEGNFAATLDGFQGGISWTPGNSGFGAPQIQCTSGLYDSFFGGGSITDSGYMSEDCYNLVNAPLQTTRKNKQDVIELNLQGGLFDLPAGEVRGAIGYQYRDNSSIFNPDQLQSYYSFTDQVVGLYAASYLDASTDVNDYYGELLVPVVRDLPYLQNLELELGVRASEYEYADSTTTWKALANIQINDSLRFRGGFNRANRAPNLGELFLSKQEVYLGPSGASFGDACGLRSNATYGAGGVLPDPQQLENEPDTQIAAGQTPEGAYSTYLICRAQMGEAAADAFYFSSNATGATASFGDWWRIQQGNPLLNSEEADTWSFGLTFSNLSDRPWLENLSGTIDWWQVDISDAIQQYSPDYAGYRCYGTRIVTNEAEAAEQAATPGCQNVPRSKVTGNQATKLVEYDNQATIETSGVDISLSWFANLRDIGIGLPGTFGISTQGTILDYYRTKQSPAAYDVEIDWKGSLGPDLTGTNPGAYDYRFFTNFSYALNDLNISLRWRYLPEVDTANTAAENAIIANNRRVAGGGEGIQINYTPVRELKVADYSVFDLSVGWQINDTLSLRAGVDNLLDAQPSYTVRKYPVSLDEVSSVCGENASIGCVNPTGPQLGETSTGITDRGYYDIMGRRFFVGIKAKF